MGERWADKGAEDIVDIVGAEAAYYTHTVDKTADKTDLEEVAYLGKDNDALVAASLKHSYSHLTH